MIIIKFYEQHFVITLCTFEWVIAKRQEDVLAPFSKRLHQAVFGSWDGFPKRSIFFAVPGIETIVTSHFKVFFRDVLDQEFYKIYGRKCLFYKSIVFVPVIVKCDVAAIIGINPFQGNDRASEIAADIFDHCTRITETGFGINIKAIFILLVDKSFGIFERRSNVGSEKGEKCCLKGLS